jgi:hypothetical protein
MERGFQAIFVVALATGCGASMTADAQMNAELNGQGPPVGADETESEEKDRARESRTPLTAEEVERYRAATAAGLNESPPVPFALFGARHDLEVSNAASAVACSCVSGLVGPPSSGNLKWQGEMPRTKPESQLVVALVPSDAGCAGGASYWGYRIEGNDVVVLLEEWKAGRPRTLGAIVPKPPPSGQIYLAPVDTKQPYGKASAGGAARCGLGNPGPQRTEGWPPGGGAPPTEPVPAEEVTE